MRSFSNVCLTRRQALGSFAAATALASIGLPVRSGAQSVGGAAGARLAASDHFLIRGGHTLTFEPSIGDLPSGDVLIRGGEIVTVAEQLDVGDADVIDASDCIVMPGFVETHWHMWNSIWRGLVADASAYFRMGSLAEHYTTEDHYTSVLYAACDAINAGITTCHNWAHGIRHGADVEAEMRALRDSGMRARMGYMGVLDGSAITSDDLRAAVEWAEASGGGRLSIGMLLDGAGDAVADQVRLARDLGLKTITDHAGLLQHPELFGPELLVTHGTGLTAEAIALIAENGIKVGLCPTTDPMIGAGLPPIHALLTGGVPLSNISFTVDVSAQTPADPFEMMRTLVNAGRIQQAQTTNLMAIAQGAPEWRFTYRDALEVGTLSGANVLGISDQVGSLTPGKRADVIVVRKDDVNMLPAIDTDPTYQLVQHAQPANVDTVVIDGRLRKYAGSLVGIDLSEVITNAAAAQTAIRRRAGLLPPG
jgi:cytosine/adenosine deaminase-related metal-dependent hydrolase